jgi:hypothetical protein
MRRLAVIRYWQTSGLMSLEETREMVLGPASGARWEKVIQERIEALGSQIERTKVIATGLGTETRRRMKSRMRSIGPTRQSARREPRVSLKRMVMQQRSTRPRRASIDPTPMHWAREA